MIRARDRGEQSAPPNDAGGDVRENQKITQGIAEADHQDHAHSREQENGRQQGAVALKADGDPQKVRRPEYREEQHPPAEEGAAEIVRGAHAKRGLDVGRELVRREQPDAIRVRAIEPRLVERQGSGARRLGFVQVNRGQVADVIRDSVPHRCGDLGGDQRALLRVPIVRQPGGDLGRRRTRAKLQHTRGHPPRLVRLPKPGGENRAHCQHHRGFAPTARHVPSRGGFGSRGDGGDSHRPNKNFQGLERA